MSRENFVWSNLLLTFAEYCTEYCTDMQFMYLCTYMNYIVRGLCFFSLFIQSFNADSKPDQWSVFWLTESTMPRQQ